TGCATCSRRSPPRLGDNRLAPARRDYRTGSLSLRGIMRVLALLAVLVTLAAGTAAAQDTVTFTHADTLRGSITPQRSWWDVVFYDLHTAVNPADSTVR